MGVINGDSVGYFDAIDPQRHKELILASAAGSIGNLRLIKGVLIDLKEQSAHSRMKDSWEFDIKAMNEIIEENEINGNS